jgi:hypothetical protein
MRGWRLLQHHILGNGRIRFSAQVSSPPDSSIKHFWDKRKIILYNARDAAALMSTHRLHRCLQKHGTHAEERLFRSANMHLVYRPIIRQI